MAGVTIFDSNQCISVANTAGGVDNFPPTPREDTLCDLVFVPEEPEVLVIEDTLKDARGRANKYVTAAPHVRFYAAAPLVGFDGARYGTLCVVDFKPRQFAPQVYNTLMNFAELVVREMERDRLVAKKRRSYEAAEQKLMRTANAYSEPVAFVAEDDDEWDMLYVNDAWQKATGVGCTNNTDKPYYSLWDMFSPIDEANSNALEVAVANQQPVRIKVIALNTDGDDVGSNQVKVLKMMPAATAVLQETVPVGVPNFVSPSASTMQPLGAAAADGKQTILRLSHDSSGTTDSSTGKTSRKQRNTWWFAVLETNDAPMTQQEQATQDAQDTDANNATSIDGTEHYINSELAQRPQVSSTMDDDSIKDIQFGGLLGSGSFGRVYRGVWRQNKTVAVKLALLPTTLANDINANKLLALEHPSLAKVLDIKKCSVDNESGTSLMCVITEYCNHGKLSDAFDRGWLWTEDGFAPQPNLRYILRTAAEIASSLKYLHSQSVVHGRLNGHNVLLTSSSKDGRGFQALLSDYGWTPTHPSSAATTVDTTKLRSVAHAAPESLKWDMSTIATDVYAFGVILWEMYCGVRAWGGWAPADIIALVNTGYGQLPWPDTAPDDYKEIVEQCMMFQPNKRPTMNEVFDRIIEILSSSS